MSAITEKDDSIKSEPTVADTAAAVPEPTEFDQILPELVANGTLLIGEHSLQLRSRKEPGLEIKVAPIRTRGLLAIGRVLTGSLRPANIYAMLSPIFEASSDSEATAAVTAAVTQLIITVPHSEREFIKLLNTLVIPAEPLRDNQDGNALVEYLDDPEPEDTINIITQMILNERPRLVPLGRQLARLAPQLQTVAAQTPEKTP